MTCRRSHPEEWPQLHCRRLAVVVAVVAADVPVAVAAYVSVDVAVVAMGVHAVKHYSRYDTYVRVEPHPIGSCWDCTGAKAAGT